MAAAVDNSRIVVPFMPSLLHLALAKVAIPFCNDFYFPTLTEVNKNIQDGDSAESNSATEGYVGRTSIRENKMLLLVPPCLRKSLLEAVHGLRRSARNWASRHIGLYVELLDGKFILYWRSDGTVDAIRTAKQLVSNESICIKRRFEIACSYGLEGSIQALWSRMKTSHNEKSFEASSLARVCIRQMADGSRLRWAQVLAEFFVFHRMSSIEPRLSSYYALLPPEDRTKFVSILRLHGDVIDDFRFYLYALTGEEEAEIAKTHASDILSLYLEWPLQRLFLETAEKLWDFIGISCFLVILYELRCCTNNRKDFDYSELLEGFWDRSPARLREHGRAGERMRLEIESCLHSVRSKRKGFDDEPTPGKKIRLL